MKNITAGTTVELKFNTVDSTGAMIAPSAALAASDFKIYKDGSATARTSTAGIVVVSPFGGKVGVHQIKINTSDNTDPGFWAAGSSYTVIPDTIKTANSVLIDGLLFDDSHFGIEYGFNGSIIFSPVSSTVGSGAVNSDPATHYTTEGKVHTWTINDAAGNAVDMSGKTLQLAVETETEVALFQISGAAITVGGASNNVVSVTIDDSDITGISPGDYVYALRDTAGNSRVFAKAPFFLIYAPAAV